MQGSEMGLKYMSMKSVSETLETLTHAAAIHGHRSRVLLPVAQGNTTSSPSNQT
jgi:hypothetical protein